MVGDYKEFKRVATIRDIALPGGDMAIKDIYRIKYSILMDALGEIPNEFATTDDLQVINMMLNKNFNTVKASSIGRLFDGVASILGIKDRVSYEGQAAVLLESKALENDLFYKYEIYNDEILKIDWRPIIRDIVNDVTLGKNVDIITAAFMNTLVNSAVEIVLRLKDIYKIDRVVISGGVFQNIYLLSKLVQILRNNNFKVYYHNRVSTNDEGMALGQLAVAEKGGGILCV
ncbi:hypothetical protein PWK10_07210 [Caloramator sp. Dgby_cultured_2]|uniref:Kae1-like domain-containing protein n=1 Tax=Caloramator sp. Dgby_cultured_2 TaxID=3029174 RepID=UPI00237DEC86|nr:hypothetical protein [Caloramator sp. Dgby_cultured_2]WDU84139.1 hypothetical protein PWK10_07210 [Caloramator sp. Dgby_cultured_2]